MTHSTPTVPDTLLIVVEADPGVPVEFYLVVIALTFIVIALIAGIARQFAIAGDLERFRTRLGKRPS